MSVIVRWGRLLVEWVEENLDGGTGRDKAKTREAAGTGVRSPQTVGSII